VNEAWPAVRRAQEIVWGDYVITLRWESAVPDGARETLAALFDGRALPVMKKGKKGEAEIDAGGLVGQAALSPGDEGALRLTARLSAGEPSLSPGHLLIALATAAGAGFTPWRGAEIVRTALLDGAGERFV
jgi:hypothetical protein